MLPELLLLLSFICSVIACKSPYAHGSRHSVDAENKVEGIDSMINRKPQKQKLCAS